MGDKHYSLPGVVNDILRLVDSGETTQTGNKPFNLLEFVGFRPKTIKSGQKKIATTGTALAIGAGVLFNGVVVTAKSTNAAAIFIGPNGVTTTDDGTGNSYRLEPGQSMSYAVANLSAIFINGTAGDSVYFSGN